jgi:hypothetical protein
MWGSCQFIGILLSIHVGGIRCVCVEGCVCDREWERRWLIKVCLPGASRIFSLLSLSLPSKPPTIWDLFETGSKSLIFNETYWPILQWQWGRKHGLHTSLPWTCTDGDLTLYYSSPTPSLVSPCPCFLCRRHVRVCISVSRPGTRLTFTFTNKISWVSVPELPPVQDFSMGKT